MSGRPNWTKALVGLVALAACASASAPADPAPAGPAEGSRLLATEEAEARRAEGRSRRVLGDRASRRRGGRRPRPSVRSSCGPGCCGGRRWCAWWIAAWAGGCPRCGWRPRAAAASSPAGRSASCTRTIPATARSTADRGRRHPGQRRLAGETRSGEPGIPGPADGAGAGGRVAAPGGSAARVPDHRRLRRAPVHLRFTQILRYQLDGAPAADGVAEPADRAARRPAGCSSPACFRAANVPPAAAAWWPSVRAKRTAIDSGQRATVAGRSTSPIDSSRRSTIRPSCATLSSPLACWPVRWRWPSKRWPWPAPLPGDVAVWLGGDPLARLGARVAGRPRPEVLPAGRPRRPAAGLPKACRPPPTPRRCPRRSPPPRPPPEATPRASSATSSPLAPMPPSGLSPPSWPPPAER